MYAELAVYQAPVRRTFDYVVPAGMSVSVGQLVEVSFRTGRSQAIVLALSESSAVPNPKPILDVLLPEPVVTPAQIELARWMAEHTMSSISACLWLTLPPGLARKGDLLFTLVDTTLESPYEVIRLLRERGPLRAAQIDRALPRSRWREALRPLIEQGVVLCTPVSPTPDARVRTVRTVQLAIPPDQAPEALKELTRSLKQAQVLEFLARQPGPLDLEQVMEETDSGMGSIRGLVDKGLIALGVAERWRDPLAGREFAPATPPRLTPAQAECWEAIRRHIEAVRADPATPSQVFLLHGVTGSGKTEIYLRAIELVLAQGRGAIVLVPEIALVAQTVQRFAARFPGQVSVVHSALTPGEQYDTWRRARAGQIGIVVGARSALFTPLPDVGLVALDEEHDDSYKQSPPLPPPYYHARETAIAMMRISRGTVILGSATPDVITVARAGQGEIAHLRLPDRVFLQRDHETITVPLPPVQVVDMRRELQAGNRSMFSRALRAALEQALARGEQTMLFLNRRGTATFVLCRDCGYVAKCPRCDMPLTFHQADEQLACHYCGYHAPQVTICPECKSSRIRYFGAGTASVEEALVKEFPAAQVLRWDRDTAHGRGAHEAIWQQFAGGQANVLVGTQMIVKGLDLPRVTLVGVLLADTALGLPDYRAGERTFQLLTQAAGRAGRGRLGGQVIFQTYQPEHYAIQAASGHDYEQFYTREIGYRRELQYPPFKRLVRFQFRHESPAKVQAEAEQMAETLRARIAERAMTATELIGPAPCFFGRIDDVYRWHIIAKTTDPKALLEDLTLRPGATVDIDPLDIL
jgi:primosomal protein N' (replication factor Y)